MRFLDCGLYRIPASDDADQGALYFRQPFRLLQMVKAYVAVIDIAVAAAVAVNNPIARYYGTRIDAQNSDGSCDDPSPI